MRRRADHRAGAGGPFRTDAPAGLQREDHRLRQAPAGVDGLRTALWRPLAQAHADGPCRRPAFGAHHRRTAPRGRHRGRRGRQGPRRKAPGGVDYGWRTFVRCP